MSDTGEGQPVKPTMAEKSWPLRVAAGLSAIYVLTLLAALLFMDTCPESAGNSSVGRDLACRLPANEVGDFLAGVFAPLAFLWLAAAVFIQAKELREQRAELHLTRLEYELARGEAIETRKVLKEQADYVAAQTQAAEAAEERRTREETDEVFDELLRQLKKAHESTAATVSFAGRDGRPNSHYIRPARNTPDDPVEYIELSRKFASQSLYDASRSYAGLKPAPPEANYKRTLYLIEQLIALDPKLSSPHRARLLGLDLPAFKTTLERIELWWKDGAQGPRKG